MLTHFLVRSETYAEKTRRLLERRRFHFRMQKTTANEGCAYHFAVAAPAAQIGELLNAHGIPYRQLEN